MAKKLPAMHLYTGDWKKDQDLSKCSAATRGAWIDLLCAMHDDDRSGHVGGTIDGLAKVARCTPDEMQMTLWELALNDAADVEVECPDGVRRLSADCPRFVRDLSGLFPQGVGTYVTVINRRMSREYQERTKSLSRKQKERDRRRASRSKSQEGHGDCHEKVTRPLSSSTSTSVPSPTCPQDVTPVSEDPWGGVVGDLLAVGIVAANATVETAKANRCPPELVAAVIEHWRANVPAWGEGALVERIRNLQPGHDPRTGWPAISKAAEAEKRTAENAAKLARQLATRDAHEAEREQNAKAREELESRFGTIVDAMTCDDQRAIIRRHAESEAAAKFDCSRVKPGKPIGTVREKLFELLQLEQAETFA